MKLLRQAVATGLVGGALWGALEALVTLLRYVLPARLVHGLELPSDAGDWLAVVLLRLGRRDERDLAAPRALVAAIVFINLYWWTKPWWAFSWGLPFHHPERLALTAAWAVAGLVAAFLLVRPLRRPLPAAGLVACALFVACLAGGVVEKVLAHSVTSVGASGEGPLQRLATRWARVTPTEGVDGLLGWVVAGAVLAFAAGRPAWLRAPSRRTAVLTVAALLAGGGWAQWREGRLAGGVRAPPGGRPPNVLLVVNDALRADRLGCYGHRRDPPVSPSADRLAGQGVLFERAVAQAPFTWTSFGSFLTGKYPRRHGLMNMLPNQRLDVARNRTLAQALSEAGYVTGAFMTGTLSHGSGLVAGFDTWFEAMVGHDPVTRASKWSIVRGDLLLERIRSKVRQAFDPRLVNTFALDWIDRQADRPFFAMVHYYATHTPYDPPAPYDRMYDPDYAGPFHPFTQSMGVALMRKDRAGRDAVFGARDLEHVEALYDGGVRFADDMLGDLLERLDRLGVADDTLVVLTSDHGEELYDHGVFEHDWMFDTNLHVPLVVRLPRGEAAGTRVAWPVELIDLPVTVLDAVAEGAGREAADGLRGAAGLPDADGRSLLPDARGARPADDELWCFSENNRYIAMTGPRLKLVVNRQDRTLLPRVWDLQADPGETRELHPADLCPGPGTHALHPDRDLPRAEWDALIARFAAWDKTQPSLDSLPVFEDDPEMAKRLQALGYTGPNGMREEDLPPADPSGEGRR